MKFKPPEMPRFLPAAIPPDFAVGQDQKCAFGELEGFGLFQIEGPFPVEGSDCDERAGGMPAGPHIIGWIGPEFINGQQTQARGRLGGTGPGDVVPDHDCRNIYENRLNVYSMGAWLPYYECPTGRHHDFSVAGKNKK